MLKPIVSFCDHVGDWEVVFARLKRVLLELLFRDSFQHNYYAILMLDALYSIRDVPSGDEGDQLGMIPTKSHDWRCRIDIQKT